MGFIDSIKECFGAENLASASYRAVLFGDTAGYFENVTGISHYQPEEIKMCLKKGFLIVRPRVGTFVEDYRKNGTLDTLVSIMKYNGGNLAKDEIKAILELRIVLVNLAATLAIDNATDEQLNSLLPILNDISPEDSVDDLVEKTFRLHHELAFISGNVLLPLFFMSFKELVCKLWHRFITNYGKELLVKSNCNMINSVITRDKDGAVAQITNATMEAIAGSKKIY